MIFAVFHNLKASAACEQRLVYSKYPGPEDPALVIPRGDLVFCKFNGSME
ncbi:unnamed protein product [marine sediment metagenome]|uniref:Uncharacterized protein n=1 Tax=marine sediment metagenome TaxID=412755 RepID=X0UIM6_9ZZZZ